MHFLKCSYVCVESEEILRFIIVEYIDNRTSVSISIRRIFVCAPLPYELRRRASSGRAIGRSTRPADASDWSPGLLSIEGGWRVAISRCAAVRPFVRDARRRPVARREKERDARRFSFSRECERSPVKKSRRLSPNEHVCCVKMWSDDLARRFLARLGRSLERNLPVVSLYPSFSSRGKKRRQRTSRRTRVDGEHDIFVRSRR